MNPIKQFEIALERACKAELPDQARAQQLLKVGSAIDHYLLRLKSSASDADYSEEWQHLKVERAVEYLEHLARDSRTLAGNCSRAVSASVH